MRIATGDLEADGLLDTATRVWCGVFKESTGVIRKFRPHEIPQMLKYMDTIDVLKMHHGIGYDWPLLEKLYGYTYKGKKVDTLIMSRLLNPKRLVPPNSVDRNIGPHSVEAWGYRLGRNKPSHEDWSQFSEEMLHRCTEDVEIQEGIYNSLMVEAGTGNWRNAFLLSFELFENLQKQEQYGWLVDRPHMEACVKQLTRWMAKIDKAITPYLPLIVEQEESKIDGEYKYIKKPFLKSGKHSQSVIDWYANTGCSPNSIPVGGCFSRLNFRRTDLNSNMETKDFLLELGWEPLEWNYNDAGEKTSPKLSKDDPFDGIESKIGKLVAKRVQCRQRRGIIEGLIQLIRPDGRIGSAINTLAVTGRATHRNIVNIPRAGSFYGKQMRKAFTSRKGYTLVGTDSDSCQLRMLAARMGSAAYIDAICNGDKKKGTDNHSLTAKVGDLESRDVAKNTMYCLIFGGGDPKLAKTAKKPVGSGKALREKIYRGLDGFEALVEKLTAEWKKTARQRYNAKFNRMEYFDGKIIGLDGRPIVVPSEHMILVYLLQSDEAIMMAKAYNLFHTKMEQDGYIFGEDYGTVCWMHDEFNVECKIALANIVAKHSEDSIREAGEFFKIPCPHQGQAKIGINWYEIH